MPLLTAAWMDVVNPASRTLIANGLANVDHKGDAPLAVTLLTLKPSDSNHKLKLSDSKLIILFEL